MASMFYEPALAILKAVPGRQMSASEVRKRILAEYPELKWGGTQGPVRAMLLTAAEKGTPIKQVPGLKPPRFYYDASEPAACVAPPEPSEEEVLEAAFQKVNSELKAQLLKRICAMDDADFEVLVNRLVSRLGFGEDVTTPKNNDHGIDGYIFGDRLGLNVICVQAKKFVGHNVQRPQIDAFIGALEGRDGVFVTTSGFSPEARQKAAKTGSTSKIALIDGDQLVEFMIEYNLGVQDAGRVYTLKKIDEDFFNEFS